jgi:hypothetical protein
MMMAVVLPTGRKRECRERKLMAESELATIQADVPVRLYKEMQMLVKEGWFRDLDELMSDALRRFVESHRAELMERSILEDVEWGLHGDE